MSIKSVGKRDSKAAGFTLFELMIVLSIVAVISSLAAPSMQRTWVKWTSDKTVRDIVHLVQQSKAKAAQLGEPIVICGAEARVAEIKCQKVWSERVVAFVDADRDGRLSAGERLYRELYPFVDQGALQLISNRKRYKIRPNGTLKSTPGSVLFCAPGHVSLAKRVVIDRVGRTRVTALNSRGKPISRC